MRARPITVSLVALAALLATGACTSSAEDGFQVISNQTECIPERTSFDAGELTFTVKNEGNEPTELYVFGEGDKVISEVENVGPGTSRSLTVDLAAGDYQLGCKPGQKGNGIRADITVTGEGGKVSAGTQPADREVEMTAVDHSFDLGDPKIKAGETILFEMKNEGEEPHEFEVFDPDDKILGEIAEVDPGRTGQVTLTFEQPGTYRYICDVDDHQSRGMKGTFTVTAV
jgi:uncharacterized cupredoxin-like copper-binding protein